MSQWLRVIEHHDNGRCTLTIDGELFSADAQDLVGAVRRILSTGCRELRLDLQGVSYLDSSGIDALLAARRLALVSEAEFEVTNPSPIAMRLLHATGTLTILSGDQ